MDIFCDICGVLQTFDFLKIFEQGYYDLFFALILFLGSEDLKSEREGTLLIKSLENSAFCAEANLSFKCDYFVC